MGKIDQESLAVLELANRELRQDLRLALILISRKKQTFNNLDRYEEKKRVLFEQNESDNQVIAGFFTLVDLSVKKKILPEMSVFD